eukprot:scaffold35539_cov35-Tisochrysis_lutea.AAC.1
MGGHEPRHIVNRREYYLFSSQIVSFFCRAFLVVLFVLIRACVACARHGHPLRGPSGPLEGPAGAA